MFSVVILSKFNSNMATTNTLWPHLKKIKDSPYKWTPKTSWYFHKFLIIYLYIFFQSLIMQAKFHEIAKYIILYSKMELLQPESLKMKKFPLKNYVIKKSFTSNITNFKIELRQKISYKRGMKMNSPR